MPKPELRLVKDEGTPPIAELGEAYGSLGPVTSGSAGSQRGTRRKIPVEKLILGAGIVYGVGKLARWW